MKKAGEPMTIDTMLFDDFERRRALCDLPYSEDDANPASIDPHSDRERIRKRISRGPSPKTRESDRLRQWITWSVALFALGVAAWTLFILAVAGLIAGATWIARLLYP